MDSSVISADSWGNSGLISRGIPWKPSVCRGSAAGAMKTGAGKKSYGDAIDIIALNVYNYARRFASVTAKTTWGNLRGGARRMEKK